MIVLFLSCGVIYLKYYAVRIWAGFPGRVYVSTTCVVYWILEISGKHSGNHKQSHQSVTFIFYVKKLWNLQRINLEKHFYKPK